ncbi:type II toxin-antitoxin system Phd/YefM family antitoxin [Streptomyces winkii]|uniref:type II toxin-antitoxin system Phd/YefM family antitoxin n=1 Tax=Streptomyces winkii TaxID=3051178 RepID=UPI0028D094BD|nr:type II toxin-antitoxin system Phd/YefM family antitoxin [Streptomyces sp. DSM 40971]
MNDETSEPRTCSVAQAESMLDSLVRRVARTRERITITDQGREAAVLISPEELAGLDRALAAAEYRALFTGGVTEHSKISEVLGRDGDES